MEKWFVLHLSHGSGCQWHPLDPSRLLILDFLIKKRNKIIEQEKRQTERACTFAVLLSYVPHQLLNKSVLPALWNRAKSEAGFYFIWSFLTKPATRAIDNYQCNINTWSNQNYVSKDMKSKNNFTSWKQPIKKSLNCQIISNLLFYLQPYFATSKSLLKQKKHN